ncbi:MAG: UvrD-helicase domain-containing protein [Fibrobacterota bacterium]
MIRTPNKSQQEAIESTDGPLLSIAGPGSRKTYTLVERMVLLARTKSAAP